jgi:hypothetical protein
MVECENLGCYPKITKLGAAFPLKTSLSKKLSTTIAGNSLKARSLYPESTVSQINMKSSN